MSISSPNLGSTLTIFIDTEFTDFVNTDLISLGMVASNGQEFYGENIDFIKAFSSKWVTQNIYPLLDNDKCGMKRSELSARAWSWIDDLPCDFVNIMVDYHGDYELLFDLFGEEKHPKLLEVKNIYASISDAYSAIITDNSPNKDALETIIENAKKMFQQNIVDYFIRTKLPAHHALHDARANKEAYGRLARTFGLNS